MLLSLVELLFFSLFVLLAVRLIWQQAGLGAQLMTTVAALAGVCLLYFWMDFVLIAAALLLPFAAFAALLLLIKTVR